LVTRPEGAAYGLMVGLDDAGAGADGPAALVEGEDCRPLARAGRLDVIPD
jgi:hypothetical protein